MVMETRCLPIAALLTNIRQASGTRSSSFAAQTHLQRRPFSHYYTARARRNSEVDVTSGNGKRRISSTPSIPTCPAPTCPCAAMPKELDIDYDRLLEGSMALYHSHVLIPTGRSDWKSRIEEDESLMFLRNIKSLLTKNGKYANPFHNVLVSASSFPQEKSEDTVAALLLPSFQYVTATAPRSSPSSSLAKVSEQLVKGFILPETLDARAAQHFPQTQHASLERDSSHSQSIFSVKDAEDVLVLICGHGTRDERCGVMGTLLQREFEGKLASSTYPTRESFQKSPRATVGLISHIGGHAFAGNVIVYVSPLATEHPLAGKGIWYGRVEPRHVEGIIKETIEAGKVIKDLFRGGVDGKSPGEMLRLV